MITVASGMAALACGDKVMAWETRPTLPRWCSELRGLGAGSIRIH